MPSDQRAEMIGVLDKVNKQLENTPEATKKIEIGDGGGVDKLVISGEDFIKKHPLSNNVQDVPAKVQQDVQDTIEEIAAKTNASYQVINEEKKELTPSGKNIDAIPKNRKKKRNLVKEMVANP